MEGEKNKLENLLHNNLMKKRDRVLHDLQEVSVADRRHKLEQYQTELEQEDEKLANFKEQTKGSWAVQSGQTKFKSEVVQTLLDYCIFLIKYSRKIEKVQYVKCCHID